MVEQYDTSESFSPTVEEISDLSTLPLASDVDVESRGDEVQPELRATAECRYCCPTRSRDVPMWCKTRQVKYIVGAFVVLNNIALVAVYVWALGNRR